MRQTDDSARWIKYQTPSFRYMMLDTSEDSRSPLLANLRKPSPYKSALAERLARLKAQAAAATIGIDTLAKASGGAANSPPSPDTAPKPPPAARKKDSSDKTDPGRHTDTSNQKVSTR